MFDEEERIQAVREAVENYFERENAKYQPFDERNIARAGYSVRTKFGSVSAFFHAQKDALNVRMILPINAEEAERTNVGEYLLRANYGFKIGGFDFDFSDGEISYRVSLYCGEDEFVPPTYEQIDNAVMVGLAMIHKYGDSLVKVVFGIIEPEEAIELVEGNN